MKKIRRIVSVLLICCMAAVLPPMSALAEGGADLGYTTIDGVIFNKDCTTLIQYPMNSDATTYRIPDGVTTIGENAFANNHTLKNVIFPDSLTTIGNNAFFDCAGILNYHLPDGVTTIGKSAFARCRNYMLEDVEPFYIPASVTSIGSGAFDDRYMMEFSVDPNNKNYTAVDGVLFSKDCTALLRYPGGKGKSYVVPAGVKRIEGWAFASTGLESISFPGGLVSIGDWAFYRCSVTEINFNGTKAQWERISVGEHNDELTYDMINFISDAPAFRFGDVRSTDYFYAPVQWAVERGITTGTGANTFSPDKTCTRAEILTFLWRSLGSPEPSPIYASYSDSYYYTKAIAWATERQWISGYDYEPTVPCTRLEAVEYLWKCAGSPDAPGAGFADVSSKAVDWALSKGVTNGTGATTFSPADTCTRGQIVTFLYRALG